MVKRGWFDREGSEFGRGIGFFDAIYGFAITLLIANVDLPPAEAWQSLGALLDSGLGDQLLAFAISFAVIAVFWKSNANLMARFRGIDGPVIAANLLSAGIVVLLPFTTQGISDAEVSELPLPTALYAVNVALVILSEQLIFEVGRARGLLVDQPSTRVSWAWRVDSLAQVAVFAASIPVAYVAGAGWGRTVWVALVVVSPLTGRWVARISEREAERIREREAELEAGPATPSPLGRNWRIPRP